MTQSNVGLRTGSTALPGWQIDETLAFLAPLSYHYPLFDQWYREVVWPGLIDGSRFLFRLERQGELAAVGIAKNDGIERKICTVRVASHFVNRGLGLYVFDGLLSWLGTDLPHLTVSDDKLPSFERIFDWYGFAQTSRWQDRYRTGHVEWGYNDYRSMSAPEPIDQVAKN